jgi:ABC-2 type transport system permease protein
MISATEREAVPATGRIRRATFGDALRSEWTKVVTVRSTYWTLFVAALLGVGLAALIMNLSAAHYRTDPSVRLDWHPVDRSMRSLELAQLAFAVFGVLVVTAEYATGMVRTSFAAVPKRIRMMTAKLTVFTWMVFLAGEVIAFAAFLLGQYLILGRAPSANLGQHLVFRAVFGAGLYLVLVGLLAAAIAVLVRQAAAGIGIMVGILFILPGVFFALPTSWSQPIEEYWPTNAGQQVAMLSHDSHTLGPWVGFAYMLVFTLVVIAVAFFVLERRDA